MRAAATRQLKQLRTKLRLGLLLAVVALCIGQDHSIIAASVENGSAKMEANEATEAEVIVESEAGASIDENKKKNRWRALRSNRLAHRRPATKFQVLPWIQSVTVSSLPHKQTLTLRQPLRQTPYQSIRISTELPRLC